jgi:hypothetical protein
MLVPRELNSHDKSRPVVSSNKKEFATYIRLCIKKSSQHIGLLCYSISGFLRHTQTEDWCTVSGNTEVESFWSNLGREEPTDGGVMLMHSSPGRKQILFEHSYCGYEVHTELFPRAVPVPASQDKMVSYPVSCSSWNTVSPCLLWVWGCTRSRTLHCPHTWGSLTEWWTAMETQREGFKLSTVSAVRKRSTQWHGANTYSATR